MSTPEVQDAIQRARQDGFRGELESTTQVGDARHVLYLCVFGFNDGSTDTYLVACDAHEGGGAPALMPLSTAVHILQNITQGEQWEIETRPAPSNLNSATNE